MVSQLVQLFQIKEEEAALFLAAFEKKVLPKKTIFLSEGAVCNQVGLIEKGLMVCLFPLDGKDQVDEFAYENSFICNYVSFLQQSPSEKEIRCLEDTHLYVIEREALEALGQQHLFVREMSRKMNEILFLRTSARLQSFQLQNATERYWSLMNQRRDLAQRIPQYLLASYLNVQAETISRIRRKSLEKIP